MLTGIRLSRAVVALHIHAKQIPIGLGTVERITFCSKVRLRVEDYITLLVCACLKTFHTKHLL